MSLTTIGDVQFYLGHDLSDRELIGASFVFIPNVEAEAALAMNRPIDVETVVEEHVITEPLDQLHLRRGSVIEIDSVSLNGVAFATADWYAHPSYAAVGFNAPILLAPLVSPYVLSVTYRAGAILGLEAEQLRSARSVIAARVARMVNKMIDDDAAGVETITVEGYTVRYTPDGWTSHEADVLLNLRRRTIV